MTVEGWAVVVADVVAVLVFVVTDPRPWRRPVVGVPHTLPRAKVRALRRGRYELKR